MAMRSLAPRLVLGCCLLTLASASLQSDELNIVRISTSNVLLLRLVKDWQPQVSFFTPAESPLTTLDGLSREAVACENSRSLPWQCAQGFLYALMAPGEGDLRLMSTDAFNAAAERPSLYVAWSHSARTLRNVLRVEFVPAKDAVAAPPAPPAEAEGTVAVPPGQSPPGAGVAAPPTALVPSLRVGSEFIETADGNFRIEAPLHASGALPFGTRDLVFDFSVDPENAHVAGYSFDGPGISGQSMIFRVKKNYATVAGQIRLSRMTGVLERADDHAFAPGDYSFCVYVDGNGATSFAELKFSIR